MEVQEESKTLSNDHYLWKRTLLVRGLILFINWFPSSDCTKNDWKSKVGFIVNA